MKTSTHGWKSRTRNTRPGKLSRKRNLQCLQPHYSGRERPKFRLLKHERWLRQDEVECLQRAAKGIYSQESVGVVATREAIETAWIARPENSAAAFTAGVESGRKAMKADMRRFLSRSQCDTAGEPTK